MIPVRLLCLSLSVFCVAVVADEDLTAPWTARQPDFGAGGTGKAPAIDYEAIEKIASPQAIQRWMHDTMEKGLNYLHKLPGMPPRPTPSPHRKKLSKEEIKKLKLQYDVWGNKKKPEEYQDELNALIAKTEHELVPITATNFTDMSNGSWFLMVYAKWCTACQKVAPKYQLFSVGASKRMPGVRLARMDAEENSVAAGLMGVVAFPTFLHFKDGHVRTYTGNSSMEGVEEFIKAGWQREEPWRYEDNPFSFHMMLLRRAVELALPIQDYVVNLNKNGVSWGTLALTALVLCVVGGAVTSHLLVRLFDLLLRSGSKKEQQQNKAAPPPPAGARTRTKSKKED